MSTPFPHTIDFSLVKPKGYSAQVVNREFTPAPFNQNIAQQDLIRFVIQQHRGFLDPYSTTVDVELNFAGMSPTGLQQLDGTAHSIISRFQLYVNGSSLELIDEYDSLIHFLNDMQVGRENKRIKLSEGGGQDEGGNSGQSLDLNGGGKVMSHLIQNAGFVAIAQRPNQWFMDDDVLPAQLYPGINSADSSGFLNIPQALANVLTNCEPGLWSQITFNKNAGVGDPLARYIPLNRYEKKFTRTNFQWSPINLGGMSVKQATGASASGIFSGNFCNHTFEDYFTINYPTLHVRNGNIGALDVIQTACFQFPLASSIIGVLLPSESYKYIPWSALPELVLEFTLNKYAFFTSGYIEDKDVLYPPQTFQQMACMQQPRTQQQRFWKITKFNINMDIIIFDDPAIEDMINAQLITSGILMHTCGWTLCLKQVLATTAMCAGNFQINYGFESLKGLIILFELNDYMQFTYCRKHWRASRNVTSLQLRIGDKIYPQQPIQGHGGNALKYVDAVKTNTQFVQELYKLFGKQYTINGEANINLANFAPNKRPYHFNPTNVAPVFDNTFLMHQDIQVNLGAPLLFENQVRGMAAYVINLDVLGSDNNVMGGVDTKSNIPFNVLITTDTTDTGIFQNGDLPAETPCTGQFWAYYDVLYLFKAGQTPQKIGAQ